MPSLDPGVHWWDFICQATASQAVPSAPTVLEQHSAALEVCPYRAVRWLIDRLVFGAHSSARCQAQSVIRVKDQSKTGPRAVYLAKVKVTICTWVRDL